MVSTVECTLSTIHPHINFCSAADPPTHGVLEHVLNIVRLCVQLLGVRHPVAAAGGPLPRRRRGLLENVGEGALRAVDVRLRLLP